MKKFYQNQAILYPLNMRSNLTSEFFQDLRIFFLRKKIIKYKKSQKLMGRGIMLWISITLSREIPCPRSRDYTFTISNTFTFTNTFPYGATAVALL